MNCSSRPGFERVLLIIEIPAAYKKFSSNSLAGESSRTKFSCQLNFFEDRLTVSVM
jgi:hypothetical protein